MGRNVPREYEFFPGKGGKSTSSKDLEFPLEEASVAVHGEASWFTPTAYYSDSNACGPSNSIDLSLKLSVQMQGKVSVFSFCFASYTWV